MASPACVPSSTAHANSGHHQLHLTPDEDAEPSWTGNEPLCLSEKAEILSEASRVPPMLGTASTPHWVPQNQRGNVDSRMLPRGPVVTQCGHMGYATASHAQPVLVGEPHLRVISCMLLGEGRFIHGPTKQQPGCMPLWALVYVFGGGEVWGRLRVLSLLGALEDQGPLLCLPAQHKCSSSSDCPGCCPSTASGLGLPPSTRNHLTHCTCIFWLIWLSPAPERKPKVGVRPVCSGLTETGDRLPNLPDDGRKCWDLASTTRRRVTPQGGPHTHLQGTW